MLVHHIATSHRARAEHRPHLAALATVKNFLSRTSLLPTTPAPSIMLTCPPTYSPTDCKALRVAQGGYPSLTSLPEGLATQSSLAARIDAADRAFIRSGMSCDDVHHVEDGKDHPLLQAFKRDNPGAQGERLRREFLLLLRKDLYDVVSCLLPSVHLSIAH